MSTKLLDIHPSSYKKHFLHGESREWNETNCYVDVWIELLHANGFDPIAALPFTFGVDFEGDQWTFFKYPLIDLATLYNLDVQELNIWRGLLDCIEEQLRQNRPVLVELDSFFLPDTKGTAYQIEHVKTTVAINEIDRIEKKMGYFHNQSYHQLAGDDFSKLFLDTQDLDDRVLPPYVEYVKPLNKPPLTEDDITHHSIECLRRHLKQIPTSNPFIRYMDRFERESADLEKLDLDYFHRYSFATLRQYGAAFELCKTYLEWLNGRGFNLPTITEAAELFGQLSSASKRTQFQFARAAARKKPLDLSSFTQDAIIWEQAMELLKKSVLCLPR
jgi:hypothetical protein